VRTYVFDSLNREVLRSFSLPPTPVGKDRESIATTYDAANNATQILEHYHGTTIPDRTTRVSFDDFDREISRTDAFGKTLRYAYDANGNRTQLTDADGKTTRYRYDALNRPTAVESQGGATGYLYDRSGRVVVIAYPNGVRVQQFYELAGRISVIDNRSGAAVVSRYEYAYDRNGNRVKQIETNGAGPEETTYAYDSLDRLERVTYAEGVAGAARTTSYSYDAAYNRTGERIMQSSDQSVLNDRSYTYNNRNELALITDAQDAAGSIAYAYDPSGNQIQKTTGGLSTQFAYDGEDQLRSVQSGGAPTAEFLYDHRGLRVGECQVFCG
jgi:YD repeat-containing protein